jgi:EAL domain-containing protein (putative c-di-GMP-specific phosphodiesterase class I)
MVAIKHHGSRLALDDFGCGLCSFTYLKKSPGVQGVCIVPPTALGCG